MLKKLRKVLSVFIILGLILSSAISVNADYPIFYQRYTADPCCLVVGDRLYLYCSHDVYDPNHPGYIMNDITCISTDDLKNWTDHGEVFKAPNWGAKLSWAPVVVTKNNKYYMYFGNNAGGIGVAVSNSPTGPFTDALGKALITGSSPGVNPPSGFWCFDPGALVDDDGQAYIYFGGGSVDNNTRAFKLGSDMISLSGSAVTIPMPNMFEDSYIHKYKGKYYYSCCIRPGSGTKIEYMMSDSPLTGFVYKGTVMDCPPDNEGNNNHHGIVEYKGSWYIAYHNREVAILNNQPKGDARTFQRSVCIDKLEYNADGTIKKVTITKDGLTQLKKVNPYITNEAETMAQESGINTEACSEGGRDVNLIENGDWVRVRGVDFGSGAVSFDARVASATSGGNIEIHLDSPTGTLVGTCAVQGTGGSQTWATKSCKVTGASSVHDLYLKFTGGSGNLFNLNWWKFSASTSSPTSTPTSTPTPTRASTPTPTRTSAPTSTPTTIVNRYDLNNDGVINMADVIILAGKFNTTKGNAGYAEACDLNNDGAINMADVILIAAKFNTVA
ncbi:MAG: carbohydrate-binding protein [Bacillota bacterium]|nr:carbohydrate-binding protein [Bacillota bacterium]